MRVARDRMAATAQNREAGEFLAGLREELGLAHGAFAEVLGVALDISVARSTLAGWESGYRLVPAAALLAALELVGRPLNGEPPPAPEHDAVDRLAALVEDTEAVERLAGLVEALRSRVSEGARARGRDGGETPNTRSRRRR